MKAILLIDHGSTRAAANEMLSDVAQLLSTLVDEDTTVHFAHMELAAPDVDEGFDACVRDGADEIIVFPYMLSPGKHSTTDIPRMVEAAARRHPSVRYAVTPPFGVERGLAEVILRRASAASFAPAT